MQDGDHGGGDVEPAVRVRRVLGVAQDSLLEVVGEHDAAGGRDADAEFQLRAPDAVERGAVVDFLYDVLAIAVGVGVAFTITIFCRRLLLGRGGIVFDVRSQGMQVDAHEPR